MPASAIHRGIPWSFVALRAVLGPGIAVAALHAAPGYALSAIVLVALLSDIYDGILARRWHTDTPALRLSDSLADTVFYLGVLAALWHRKPDVVRHLWPLLTSLLALEAARYIYDLRKFGKAASYHTYLSKAWALVMAIALIGVFASSYGAVLLGLSLALGILCDIEGLVISSMLLQWQNDIPGIRAARQVRRRQESKNSA